MSQDKEQEVTRSRDDYGYTEECCSMLKIIELHPNRAPWQDALAIKYRSEV